jgi:hypothetical protein
MRASKRKLVPLLGLAILGLLCLMTSGCFTIEQEIFLDADGGGDALFHITMPDLPENMSKPALGTATTDKTNPGDDLVKLKKEVTTGLPPTITIKEIKEVKQNGSTGFYVALHFKDLKDVEAMLANLGKDSLKEGELSDKTEWRMRLDKTGEKSSYNASLFIDITDAPGGKQGEAKKAGKADAGDELGKQLMPLFLGSIKLRFILHTPSPITETNADIVLRGRTAVWDCSLITFLTSKKPIRMTAIY